MAVDLSEDESDHGDDEAQYDDTAQDLFHDMV